MSTLDRSIPPEVEILHCAREECVPTQKVRYRQEEDRDYYALHYVYHGKGKLVYNGETFSLKRGDMFLISPRGETVYYPQDDWQYYWVNVRGSRVYDLLKNAGFGDFMILKNLHDDKIEDCFRYLVDAHLAADSVTALGWFYILLGRIANASGKTDGRKMAERHVEAVMQFLEYHYYYPDVNLTTLADNLAVTKNYLCKIFREKTGKTPIAYLIEIRMEDACRRLAHTNDSITSIAHTVGYKDSLYFSKEFRKRYHMTPSQYRTLHGGAAADA